MKKLLSALLASVCILLAVAVILPGANVSVEAANEPLLVGASLLLEEQASVVFCFNKDKVDDNFSFTVEYDGFNETYDKDDLVLLKDNGSSTVYQTITVGPLSVVDYNATITYSGNGITRSTISLVRLAKMGVKAYQNISAYNTLTDMLKAFANYGVAADNKYNGKSQALPYTLAPTNPKFTDTAQTNLLSAPGTMEYKQFYLNEGVYLEYVGTADTSYDENNLTVSVNSQIMEDAVVTSLGNNKYSFKFHLTPEMGTDSLRIIVRDKSQTGDNITFPTSSSNTTTLFDFGGKVIFDCIDRADQNAYNTANNAEFKEMGNALAAYLQKASAYDNAPTVLKKATGAFYAGFGRADISPYTNEITLNGSTKSYEVLDPIYASCVAIQDENGKIVLMYSIDVRNIPNSNLSTTLLNQVHYNTMISGIKTTVKNKAGITLNDDQIFLNATHNHNAPDITADISSSNNPVIKTWYQNLFLPALSEAAVKAIADLSEVDNAYTTSGIIDTGDANEHYTYNRRYSYNFLGSVTGYEDAADREMSIIRFTRSGAKDILLANWQGHAANASAINKTTADFIGTLRKEVEKDLDSYLLYINGASGDMNMTYQQKLANDAGDYKKTKTVTASDNKNRTVYEQIGSYRFDETSESRSTTYGSWNTVSTKTYIAFHQIGKEISTKVKSLINNIDESKPVTLGNININTISTNPTNENGKNLASASGIVMGDGNEYAGQLLLRYRKHQTGNKEYCLIPNSYVYGHINDINCEECNGIYGAFSDAMNQSKANHSNSSSYAYTYTGTNGIYEVPKNTYNNNKHFTCALDQYSSTGFPKQSTEFNMWTVTIGDQIGFAFCPYEMFNQNGVAIKEAEGLKDKTIFIGGYTNGYNGYIASETAFNKTESRSSDDGASEVYSTKYVKGCAEYFVDLLISGFEN